jgi:flagella basal body P-ring formation protein FlgA
VRALRALVSILVLAAVPVAGAATPAFELPATQIVPAARLTAIADREVRDVVHGPDREAQAQSSLADQQVPAGKVTISAGPAQVNPTYVAIPLTIDVNGTPVRTIYAGYRVVTYVHTAVAARDLPAGTVLTPDTLVLGRVAAPGRPPVDPAWLVGRKLTLAIASGAPVWMEETRINDIVVAGQPAVYILHDGPVVISADVIARTSGGMGQMVAVYNPSTRKELSGIVTGAGQVEFSLPGEEVQ